MKQTPAMRRRTELNPAEADFRTQTASGGNSLVVTFAKRLHKWRHDEGKTLKEIATDMGLSISIISEWEHGQRFPSVNNLLALSQYTGIPAWEFLRAP